jgi:hypothetical protein
MSKPQSRLPRNRVMTVTTLGAIAVLILLMLARGAGLLPMPQDLSPAGTIGLCAGMTVLTGGFAAWYLARTDEHGLSANLWSMAWGWIGTVLLTVNWAMLHEAGLVPPPQAVYIILASAVPVLAVWAWLRFR